MCSTVAIPACAGSQEVHESIDNLLLRPITKVIDVWMGLDSDDANTLRSSSKSQFDEG